MSAIIPISVGSLAEGAFTKLVQAITAGEFKPGERLSEANLARQLGISRGPLREALGRLEGKLVERTPRVGVRVIALSRPDLDQLLTIREALEGMGCRLAAQRVTDRDIRQLTDLLANHGSDPKVLNAKGYFQRTSDDDFHLQIMRCARNERLEALLMEGLYYQLRLYRYQSSERPGRAQQAYDEHVEIVRALSARDPDRAEQAMRRHIRHAHASLAGAFVEAAATSRSTGGRSVARQARLPRRVRAAGF
jgi:DNA-binding GntR family transcriptional regulator